MTPTIDIWVDFTTHDDTGLPWTLLSEAADPARIVAGAFVVGGNPQAQAVVEIVDVGRGWGGPCPSAPRPSDQE